MNSTSWLLIPSSQFTISFLLRFAAMKTEMTDGLVWIPGTHFSLVWYKHSIEDTKQDPGNEKLWLWLTAELLSACLMDFFSSMGYCSCLECQRSPRQVQAAGGMQAVG